MRSDGRSPMASVETRGSIRDMSSAVAPVHRLSIDDVRRMYETGILDELDRLELVDGVLVEMSPIGPEHSGAVAWLNQHLSRPDRPWHVRIQDTLVIEGGFLLPDLTVIGEPPSRAQLVTAPCWRSRSLRPRSAATPRRGGTTPAPACRSTGSLISWRAWWSSTASPATAATARSARAQTARCSMCRSTFRRST